MNISDIDFKKGDGLVPAIIQDWKSGSVLMLGFMNDEALKKTQDSGRVTFFSRSKDRLWTKGETSGNFIEVKEIKADCDRDTLLIQGQATGPVCHTGEDTCFGKLHEDELYFLKELDEIIGDRKSNPVEGSYTSSLFARGINKIAQKVGEEAVEVVIESKDDNDQLFKNEVADLLFHMMILLKARGLGLGEIVRVLKERHVQS